jgi:hypothetical protein
MKEDVLVRYEKYKVMAQTAILAIDTSQLIDDLAEEVRQLRGGKRSK